jgi:hypothetical protein
MFFRGPLPSLGLLKTVTHVLAILLPMSWPCFVTYVLATDRSLAPPNWFRRLSLSFVSIRVHSRPFAVSFLSALCALLRLFICDRGAPTELRLPFLACRARTLGRRNRFRPNETALKEIDQRSAIGAF